MSLAVMLYLYLRCNATNKFSSSAIFGLFFNTFFQIPNINLLTKPDTQVNGRRFNFTSDSLDFILSLISPLKLSTQPPRVTITELDVFFISNSNRRQS